MNKNVETAWASAMFLEIRDGKTILPAELRLLRAVLTYDEISRYG